MGFLGERVTNCSFWRQLNCRFPAHPLKDILGLYCLNKSPEHLVAHAHRMYSYDSQGLSQCLAHCACSGSVCSDEFIPILGKSMLCVPEYSSPCPGSEFHKSQPQHHKELPKSSMVALQITATNNVFYLLELLSEL